MQNPPNKFHFVCGWSIYGPSWSVTTFLYILTTPTDNAIQVTNIISRTSVNETLNSSSPKPGKSSPTNWTSKLPFAHQEIPSLREAKLHLDHPQSLWCLHKITVLVVKQGISQFVILFTRHFFLLFSSVLVIISCLLSIVLPHVYLLQLCYRLPMHGA